MNLKMKFSGITENPIKMHIAH